MYYILDNSGRIIGSSDGPVNVEDLASRGERLVESDLDRFPGELEVRDFPHNPAIFRKEGAAPARKIILATTAGDADGDGFPELLANGRSQADITARLQDEAGNPVTEPTQVHFRTSAGALSRRSVETENGTATVRLRSSRDTVTATVHASAEGFEPVSLDLEFVPPPQR